LWGNLLGEVFRVDGETMTRCRSTGGIALDDGETVTGAGALSREDCAIGSPRVGSLPRSVNVVLNESQPG